MGDVAHYDCHCLLQQSLSTAEAVFEAFQSLFQSDRTACHACPEGRRDNVNLGTWTSAADSTLAHSRPLELCARRKVNELIGFGRYWIQDAI